METEATQKPKVVNQGKPPAPPPRPVTQKEDPWQPMDSAPKDGAFVFLKGDPMADRGLDVENQWYWYKTRQYRKGCWQPVGWWRRRFGPNAPPSFTPGGWRYVKDGLPS
jgi:hypothetical protein